MALRTGFMMRRIAVQQQEAAATSAADLAARSARAQGQVVHLFDFRTADPFGQLPLELPAVVQHPPDLPEPQAVERFHAARHQRLEAMQVFEI